MTRRWMIVLGVLGLGAALAVAVLFHPAAPAESDSEPGGASSPRENGTAPAKAGPGNGGASLPLPTSSGGATDPPSSAGSGASESDLRFNVARDARGTPLLPRESRWGGAQSILVLPGSFPAETLEITASLLTADGRVLAPEQPCRHVRIDQSLIVVAVPSGGGPSHRILRLQLWRAPGDRADTLDLEVPDSTGSFSHGGARQQALDLLRFPGPSIVASRYKEAREGGAPPEVALAQARTTATELAGLLKATPRFSKNSEDAWQRELAELIEQNLGRIR